MMYIGQIIMLYSLKLYSVVCHLYLIKIGRKMYMYKYKYIYSVYISICQDFHCVLLERFHKIKGIVSYQDVALG